MIDPAMLNRYSDADLLKLIQNLSLISSASGLEPMTRGVRWRLLCEQELQRRRNLQRAAAKASAPATRVEEVR